MIHILLEWVSWNGHYTEINTIIREFISKFYSCEGSAVSHIWDDLGVVYIRETMGNWLYQPLLLDNLTNNNYIRNLVQEINIYIRDTIELEEGVYITLNIIQNKTKNKTQKLVYVA